MTLGFRRERNYAVGVLRVGSESPRAFKYHVNVFGSGCLGLRRGWDGGRRLGLITRNQEKRCKDSAGEHNQGASEVAAGFHWFLLCKGIRAVRKLRTPTSSRDERCAGWPASSVRSGGWHRKRSG